MDTKIVPTRYTISWESELAGYAWWALSLLAKEGILTVCLSFILTPHASKWLVVHGIYMTVHLTTQCVHYTELVVGSIGNSSGRIFQDVQKLIWIFCDLDRKKKYDGTFTSR